MKKKRIIIFIILVTIIILLSLLVKLTYFRFNKITLEKEPDGIFSNWSTNKLAVVTDGRLCMYDEKGECQKIPTDFKVTYVCPFESSAMVIDDKGNLYKIDYKNISNITVSDILLTNVSYVTGSTNIENEWFSYAAIDKNNNVYVWGDNNYNQLGINDEDYIEEPCKLNYIGDVKEIELGYTTSLLLTNEGIVYQAGVKTFGQYGEFSHTYFDKFTKVEFPQNALNIYLGYWIMVIYDEQIKYWFGGSYEPMYLEAEIAEKINEEEITTFSYGLRYYLGLSEDKDVYIWGYSIIDRPKNKADDWFLDVPTQIKEIKDADMIYAGQNVGYVKKGLDIIILKSY